MPLLAGVVHAGETFEPADILERRLHDQPRGLMQPRYWSRQASAGSPELKRNETGGSAPLASRRFSNTV